MGRKYCAVIMAAGKSTRMKSALPKTVHSICGKPMARHVVDACRQAGIDDVVVVIGHEADKVRESLGKDVSYALQEEQLGTGHACMQAMSEVDSSITDVVVMPGDAPLLTGDVLKSLVDTHTDEANGITMLTAMLNDAGAYGRIVRSADGRVTGIVESKDASVDQLAIREINTSIYCFDRGLLERDLSRIKTENAQGEYYLTDVIGLASASGDRIGASVVCDFRDVLGINNRVELAEAARIMRERILQRLMLDGVTIVDPHTTYVDSGVEVGADSVIYPCTVIEGKTVIAGGKRVGPFAHLKDAEIL